MIVLSMYAIRIYDLMMLKIYIALNFHITTNSLCLCLFVLSYLCQFHICGAEILGGEGGGA